MDVREGLVTRDRRTVATFVVLATLVFVVFTLLTYTSLGDGILNSTRYFQLLVLSGFLSATVCGYERGGILVGWLLAAAGTLPFGLSIALTDAPLGREPTIMGALETLAMSAGLFALVVGTVGYVVGYALRRLRSAHR